MSDARLKAFAGTWKLFGVAVTALALLFGAAIPAAAAELMRVTFVRHGESAGNASGLIDTSTPGPVLTSKGQQQAEDVVGKLGANNYDGIYASTMVRTQLTAAPMSNYLRLPTQVLPGLQEVEAGVFEGTPESEAADGYAKFPLAWAFQGMRDLRIPGSINGHEFDARVDGALKTIYDNGDRNSVVFSHGGAIMFWTMMNATNLTTEQKIELLRNYPLSNTDYVVIEGNPEDGWTVVNWNGQQLGAKPTLGAEVQLQVRTLTRQLAATAKQVVDAFATMNPAKIVAAITEGSVAATYSIAKFARAVTSKVAQPVENVSTLEAADPTEADTTPTAQAATNTVASDPTPKIKSKNEPVKTPSAAPKLEAIESPNGATDLKDGNKVVPGGGPVEQRDDTDGEKAATDADDTVAGTEPDADADADADGSDTGEDGSQQSDAA